MTKGRPSSIYHGPGLNLRVMPKDYGPIKIPYTQIFWLRPPTKILPPIKEKVASMPERLEVVIVGEGIMTGY